jgi:hypothetical protein
MECSLPHLYSFQAFHCHCHCHCQRETLHWSFHCCKPSLRLLMLVAGSDVLIARGRFPPLHCGILRLFSRIATSLAISTSHFLLPIARAYGNLQKPHRQKGII